VFAMGGVFAPIRDDRAVFQAVSVDPESHTICWPGEVDLDPYVLRGEESPVSAPAYPRRVIALRARCSRERNQRAKRECSR
jgi:hypothetical protein